MPRHWGHRWVAIAALAAVCLAMLPAMASAASPDVLPDLRMAKPRDIALVKYTSGVFAGRKLLRFTTIITNEGRGPLELRGKRDCSDRKTCPKMTVKQRIKRADGTWRAIETRAKMRYDVGDGHRHWHAIGLEGYQLWPVGTTDPEPIVGAKYGFCFFDVARFKAYGAATRKYFESGCGTPTSLTTKMGLRAGWSDTYPWNFAGQYIDVTGIPKGRYLMCVTADPKKRFRQVDTTNDDAWVILQLKASSVQVIDIGRSSCERKRQKLEGTGGGSSGARATVGFAARARTDQQAGPVMTLRTVAGAAPGLLCQLPGA